MKVCVERCFNAAHYMPVRGEVLLHGHTYKLVACVKGDVGKDSMVIDFLVLKDVVKEVIKQFNYSLIIPRKDLGKVSIKGPFKVKYAVVNGERASTEVLASTICGLVKERLKGVKGVYVRLYETYDSFVECEC